jgi:hypothetical protein
MGALPLQYATRNTSRELVNRAILEIWKGGWKSISEGEMNLASSFCHVLGRTMRIHMLTCENITVGPKGLMTRSFTWGDEFLGQAKTSLKFHAKMSQLAQRRRRRYPWVGQNKSYSAEVRMNEHALFWVNSLIP